MLNEYRRVEQLVARRAHNPEVAGSSPVPAPRKKHLRFASAFFNDVCLWQMMTLTLMMFPSEMVSASPNAFVQTSHHCE